MEHKAGPNDVRRGRQPATSNEPRLERDDSTIVFLLLAFLIVMIIMLLGWFFQVVVGPQPLVQWWRGFG